MSKTIKTYDRNAEEYEQRWAVYLKHTHDKFLEHLEVKESDTLLDLSCGTGLLAAKLLESGYNFDQLILNDPSEKMLDIAESRLSDQTNIGFSSAPAHKLPFDDNSFTRVFSLNAFHHYRHQERVVSEIRRLLKPGGHFYLQDWDKSGFFHAVNLLIRWWVSEHIDTRSAHECRRMLKMQDFLIDQEERWQFKYWKFFFLKARIRADL